MEEGKKGRKGRGGGRKEVGRMEKKRDGRKERRERRRERERRERRGREEERGFVLTGMVLLLVLPSFLLASCLLAVRERGEEGSSVKTVAERVWFTGRDAENLVRQMDLYRMQLDNVILGGIARTYERYTGLLVSLTLENSTVRLEVRDPGGTAKYFSSWQLEGGG